MNREDLKSIIMESIEDISIDKINLEDYNDMLMNSMISYAVEEAFEIESVEESFTISLEEGANLEMHAAFVSGKKDYKSAIKACKKAIKAKDYAEAKKQVEIAKKAVDTMEAEIKKCKSTEGSAIFGFFAGGLVSCHQMLLPMVGILASLGGAVLGAVNGHDKLRIASDVTAIGGSIAAFAKITVSQIKKHDQYVEDLKDTNASKEDVLNAYRNKLLVICKDFKKNLDYLSKAIDQKEKLNKEADKLKAKISK